MGFLGKLLVILATAVCVSHSSKSASFIEDETLNNIIRGSSFGDSERIEKRQAEEKRVVCYFTNWSAFRTGEDMYTAENIDPDICTHINYAFVSIDLERAQLAPQSTQDIINEGYVKFNDVKKKNPNLKTMISVGGWNEGSEKFSKLVESKERREDFIENLIAFLRKYDFDGVDMCWQYPAFRDGSKPEDKENYGIFIMEMRQAFEKEAETTGRTQLLISVVMFGLQDYIDTAFDIPRLDMYSDFINLVAYNYHIATGPVVNHHAPLYPLLEEIDDPIASQLNIDASVRKLLAEGASPEKLNLGIPSYGRVFQLEDPEVNTIGSTAIGSGNRGNVTFEAGYIIYLELCREILKGGWTVVYPNVTAMGPYAYKGDQWIGYDDEISVRKKAEYARMKGLGGIMFWTIDDDDFKGFCDPKGYPLIKAGREGIMGTGLSSNISGPQSGTQPITTLPPTPPPTPQTEPTTPPTQPPTPRTQPPTRRTQPPTPRTTPPTPRTQPPTPQTTPPTPQTQPPTRPPTPPPTPRTQPPTLPPTPWTQPPIPIPTEPPYKKPQPQPEEPITNDRSGTRRARPPLRAPLQPQFQNDNPYGSLPQIPNNIQDFIWQPPGSRAMPNFPNLPFLPSGVFPNGEGRTSNKNIPSSVISSRRDDEEEQNPREPTITLVLPNNVYFQNIRIRVVNNYNPRLDEQARDNSDY